MNSGIETLSDFYRGRRHIIFPFSTEGVEEGRSHFNIFPRKYCGFRTPYNRRDFYKLTLILGRGEIVYQNQTILIDKPALFMPCPSVPYLWTCLSDDQTGYCSLFNQQFFNGYQDYEIIRTASLFGEDSNPVLFLDTEQVVLISSYFEKMMEAAVSSYVYKNDIIRHLLGLLMHTVLSRVEGKQTDSVYQSSAPELAVRFYELLKRQFPLDSPANPLMMKSPSDFARELNVHVNHLNYVIRNAFGKTTSAVIRDHILDEAKALLLNTQWDISQVGYCLGFEEPAHFNNFFKKNTSVTPLRYRKRIVANI